MKTNKQTKFVFQKYEIAKLNKGKIIGGTGNNNGDPDTTTDTSSKCSTKPDCPKQPQQPEPFDPFDPGNQTDNHYN